MAFDLSSNCGLRLPLRTRPSVSSGRTSSSRSSAESGAGNDRDIRTDCHIPCPTFPGAVIGRKPPCRRQEYGAVDKDGTIPRGSESGTTATIGLHTIIPGSAHRAMEWLKVLTRRFQSWPELIIHASVSLPGVCDRSRSNPNSNTLTSSVFRVRIVYPVMVPETGSGPGAMPRGGKVTDAAGSAAVPGFR